MSEKFNQPITFKRGLKLKNRFVMAPMTNKMSYYDGFVTTDELNYYRMRSGGAGAVITAAANVKDNGKTWEGEISAESDAHIPSLAKLSGAIKQNGTKAILQLFHGGRMSNSSVLRGETPVSASAVPAERPDAETPREMSSEEVQEMIDCYTQAALRAVKAGFDGVELHGANTYLIQQFFSPHSNRRDDEWGGSLEKRYKFIDLLVDSVTKAVDESQAENFIVGYRFSPEEYEEPGIKIEDTLYLIDQLKEKPLDYLHISLNDYKRTPVGQDKDAPSILEIIYKRLAGQIPLIGVGGVKDGKDASALMEYADLAAVGRPLLADPKWVQKVTSGQEDLICRTVYEYERDELILPNGLWEMMKVMMPDQLVD